MTRITKEEKFRRKSLDTDTTTHPLNVSVVPLSQLFSTSSATKIGFSLGNKQEKKRKKKNGKL